jgi:hypothetical protein
LRVGRRAGVDRDIRALVKLVDVALSTFALRLQWSSLNGIRSVAFRRNDRSKSLDFNDSNDLFEVRPRDARS